MSTFLERALTPSVITLDDEEREKLAREISKDWSSGIQFSYLIVLIAFSFQSCDLIIRFGVFYSIWEKYKHFIPHWNGTRSDVDAQVLLWTESHCTCFSSHSPYFIQQSLQVSECSSLVFGHQIWTQSVTGKLNQPFCLSLPVGWIIFWWFCWCAD